MTLFMSNSMYGVVLQRRSTLLFFCFSAQAIHMDLVNDLATGAFLAVLKRFISRRGKPIKIYSDNATNFAGASAELKELKHVYLNKNHINSVYNWCLEDGIEWKFIPRKSPHCGGLRESAVKRAKLHIRQILGCNSMSQDEWHTLICQIKAIINSRPLTLSSEFLDNLDTLTPAHFFNGGHKKPQTKLCEIKFKSAKHMVKNPTIAEAFLKKLTMEYLNTPHILKYINL